MSMRILPLIGSNLLKAKSDAAKNAIQNTR